MSTREKIAIIGLQTSGFAKIGLLILAKPLVWSQFSQHKKFCFLFLSTEGLICVH